MGTLARTVRLDVLPAPTPPPYYVVRADGRDITWALRLPEVEAIVSTISAHSPVRAALTEQQRRIGQQGHVVMVGRDIGTVVMPDAELKIYLDASPEERARRRYAERLAVGEPASYEAILAAIRARDHLDSTRETAPLSRAPDAIYVDTTHLTLDAVITRLMSFIEKAARTPTSEP
ncbi:MAG: (d)CMP kinase [Ardenticatenia bacterium]|nr:(d)CMP kinase [Ardenticatenia bacterium]